MIRKSMFSVVALLAALSLIQFNGCSHGADGSGAKAGDANPEVTAALAQLSEEDRRLALAQKYCPVHPENLLGSKGRPFKLLMINQPVFLCRADCKAEAEKNPKATLAKVTELKKSNSPAK